MADLIQIRRDTKANWDAVSGSVILAIGEVGIISDQSPLQCKVGDGVSYWNQLETQAWVGTGSLDQISSSIVELSGSLEEGLSSLEANVSYVICQTSGSIVTKDISVPDFELSTHCRLIVKMEHAHTSSTAPTLRINLQNGTEKPLYYNGIVASSTNNWNDNEILDIYYDGTNYQSISIKDRTLYSLVESVNVGSQSSATNAFDSVPTTLRKLGLKVTYYDTVNTEWVTKQYIGSDLSGWSTESNWDSVDKFHSGENVKDISISNSVLGDSETTLVTQKGLSEVLGEEVLIDFSNSDIKVNSWGISYSDEHYWKNGSNYGSYLIPVTSGEKLVVEKTTSGAAMFAFLTEKPDFLNLQDGTLASLITTEFGTQNDNFFYCGTNANPSPQEGYVPEGCTYLWVCWKNYQGDNRTPTSLKITRIKDFSGSFHSGENVKDINLSNSVLGDSETTLVTQKGLSEVLGEEVDLFSRNGIITIPRTITATDGGNFFCLSAHPENVYRTALIPVTPGEKIHLIPPSESTGPKSHGSRYAFVPELTDEQLSQISTTTTGDSINIALVDGTLYRITSPTDILIPEDCKYLGIVLQAYNNHSDPVWNLRPESLIIYQIKDFVTLQNSKEIVSEIILSENNIDFSQYPICNATINSNPPHPWVGVNNNTYNSYIIPVIPGQVFTMVKDSGFSRYAFLKTVPEVIHQDDPTDLVDVNGESYFWCSTTPSDPEDMSPKTFTIPDECNYLWVSRTNGQSTPGATLPNKLSFKLVSNSQQSQVVSAGLDFNDEYIRSQSIGLSESNKVPLVTENVYTCLNSSSEQVKNIPYSGYFGICTKILVKMQNKNTNSTPKITINNGAQYDVIYNNETASEQNTWFNGELLWLQFDGTKIILSTFDETQIVGTNSVAVKQLSIQQQNVLRLANRFRFLKWTPKVNEEIGGFMVGIPCHHHGSVATYDRGTTEQSYGVPYSSCYQDQKYVGLNVSIETFLSAVNNPYSLLYTECIQGKVKVNNVYVYQGKTAWNRYYHGSSSGSNSSAYYGMVCCAFTAAVTGCLRNWNNGDFPIISEQGFEFVKISTGKEIDYDSIRVGDVFDDAGHSIAIYQLFQDVFTGKVTHVRFCECTSNVYGCRFGLMGIADFKNYMITSSSGVYSHYRYIKLYQNVLDNSYILHEFSLNTDPKNIKLNYEKISTSASGAGRIDTGLFDTAEQNNIVFNEEICTIAGDKVSFPIGKFSIGNIIAINYDLDGSSLGTYNRIKVYKRANGSSGNYSLETTYLLSDIDQNTLHPYLRNHTVKLPRPENSSYVGEYYACLANENSESQNKTYWEVLDVNVNINENSLGYELSWDGDVVAVSLHIIKDPEGVDPDPWFEGIGIANQSLISLNSKNLLDKSYLIENWRLKNVNESDVYVRLLVRGKYGITGVYKKLINDVSPI